VTIFAPLFYVLIEKNFGKRSKQASAEISDINSSGDK